MAGGLASNAATPSADAYLYDITTGQFETLPQMPQARSYHSCGVVANCKLISCFLVSISAHETKLEIFFDLEQLNRKRLLIVFYRAHMLKTLDQNKIFRSSFPSAVSHGLDIVVTGGETTTTIILSLKDSQLQWRTAASLPYAVNQGATVPYEGTFLIVGGSSNGPYLSSILQFNLETETWSERPEKLNDPRARHTAVMVSEDAVQCS